MPQRSKAAEVAMGALAEMEGVEASVCGVGVRANKVCGMIRDGDGDKGWGRVKLSDGDGRRCV